MARIPVQGSYQVTPGVRGGGASSSQSVEGSALPGRQIEAMGRGISAAAQGADTIILAERRRINEARLREAALTLRSELIASEEEYSKLKGAELVAGEKPVMRDLEEKLKRRRDEIGRGLSAPDVQDAWRVASEDMLTSYSGRARAYEAAQADFYVEQQRDGIIQASLESAVRYPATRGDSLMRARETLQEKYREAGYDGDRAAQLVQSDMAKFAEGQVNAFLADGDTDAAQAYLESASAHLSEGDAAMLGAKVGKGRAAEAVMAKADQIFAEFPAGRTMPVADMYARVRELAGDDPEAVKLLQAEVGFRVGLIERQENDAYGDTFEAAIGISLQSPGRLAGSPEFQALDPSDQQALLSKLGAPATGDAMSSADAARYVVDELKMMWFDPEVREFYMDGPEGWAVSAPAVRAQFDALPLPQQQDIRQDIARRRADGGSIGALDTALSDVVSAGKGYLPSYLGRGQADEGLEALAGKATDTTGQKVYSEIRQRTLAYVQRSGGAKIDEATARRIIAESYHAVKPKKYAAPMTFPDLSGVSQEIALMREARALAAQKLGRQPTDDEVRMAYDMVRGN